MLISYIKSWVKCQGQEIQTGERNLEFAGRAAYRVSYQATHFSCYYLRPIITMDGLRLACGVRSMGPSVSRD